MFGDISSYLEITLYVSLGDPPLLAKKFETECISGSNRPTLSKVHFSSFTLDSITSRPAHEHVVLYHEHEVVLHTYK